MGPMNYSHNEAADSKQGHEGIGKKMETWQIAFCLWECSAPIPQVDRSGEIYT